MPGRLTTKVHAINLTQQIYDVYTELMLACMHGVQGPSEVGKPMGTGMGSCSFSIDQTFPSEAAYDAYCENPLHALLQLHKNALIGSLEDAWQYLCKSFKQPLCRAAMRG